MKVIGRSGPIDPITRTRALPPPWLHLKLAICLLIWGWALPARALDLGEKVYINGYGGWAAGQTDGNEYLAGAEERQYHEIAFSLLATAEVSDELSISSQLFAESEGGETEVVLDFGFAEWEFSDALRLRGGLVKQPFGIYTEIFDVGTVRPFFDLAQGIYGPAEFVAEAYLGLGVTGYLQAGNGWGVGYDVYGGELNLRGTEAANPLIFGDEEDEEEPESEEKIKDVLGGRMSFYAPGGKLNFGLSAYFGQPDEETGDEAPRPEDESTTHSVYGMHVEYVSSEWSLRVEYAHREGGDDQVEVHAAYGELARSFGEHWQIAARYDRSDFHPEKGGGVVAGFLEHKDRAISVNYWLSAHMVFKLSCHFVDGLVFAQPEDQDDLDGETNLLQLGLQFSF